MKSTLTSTKLTYGPTTCYTSLSSEARPETSRLNVTSISCVTIARARVHVAVKTVAAVIVLRVKGIRTSRLMDIPVHGTLDRMELGRDR